MKKGPFKMKGYSYPGKSPARQEKYTRITDADGNLVRKKKTKDGLKQLTNKKKDIFIGPKSTEGPSTPFTPPPAPGNKSKGTLRGITNFEYDFPKANKLIDLKINSYKKGFNTIKKTGKKIKDYFTKK